MRKHDSTNQEGLASALAIRLAAVVLAALVVWGCSDDDSGSRASCAAPGADCLLVEAADEAGLLVGSTSEERGWSEGEVGRLLRTHFSSVTSQNELKWGSVAPRRGVYDFAHADETVAFAEENGLRMRGHVLFWHRLNGPPQWVREALVAAEDPEALARELMREHVEAVVGRYRGRIETWDVVNEPLELLGREVDSSSLFYQAFERYEDFLDHAFALARAADPEAKLFLNEIFAGSNDASFQGLLGLVQGMLARGTPIDGVGFQGHFVLAVPERERLRRRLQAFSDLGLLVEITELDVSINLFAGEPDPFAAQAEVFADVYAACLEVDGCVGVTTWNVHDGETWLDRDSIFGAGAPHAPTLFAADSMPKPAYYAARDALLSATPPE